MAVEKKVLEKAKDLIETIDSFFEGHNHLPLNSVSIRDVKLPFAEYIFGHYNKIPNHSADIKAELTVSTSGLRYMVDVYREKDSYLTNISGDSK